ncbi:MAG: type 4a pilus biogenesis protein PilO [Planctomycetota bacterium]
MPNKKNNKMQWVVAGVIVTMVVVFTLGVLLPELRKISEYEERIVLAQEELGPSFLEPTVMDQKLNEVEELKEELNTSTRYVPDRPELASVLRSLTEVVESQGISDQRLQVRETKRHKHYAELPLSLEFEDTFSSTFGVLKQIESLPRLVRLEAMNLRVVERDPSSASAPRMQASLRLSSFYIHGEEE